MTDQAALLDSQQVFAGKQGYRMWKRTQDIILSLLGLLLLWPVLLLVAIIILIDSPGACPIFTQMRVGKDGRVFKLYKFRTMHPHAEEKLAELLKYNEMNGPVFKIRNDPRITRVGKFIRKTSIDELPQLINVLKGEMSLVGPRPALPREVEQYSDYQKQRLLITPGLTCYWQIQPRRNDLSFDEWLELDLKYIRERCFLVDWRIMLSTVRVVLKMEGV